MSEVQNENLSFDNMVKELLGETSKENVIRFINFLYGADFSLDSEVTRLATETHNKGAERRSDIMLMVNDRVYHIEVESNDKNTEMVFRMFDYGYRHAITQGITTAMGSLELNFPDPIIIYLRNSDKTPTEFTVKLNFTSKESFTYKIPVKRIGDYTPEILRDGSLFAIGQFYPMKYENLLSKEHDEETERRYADELTSIFDWIGEEIQKGTISKGYAALFTDGLMKTALKVKSKAKILNEEVFDKVMENIQQRKFVLEPLNWRAEGEIKRQRETAKRMKQKNYPIEDIRDLTDLPIEEIQAL
jgi:hypothetical protein